jgi:hypothetical protein
MLFKEISFLPFILRLKIRPMNKSKGKGKGKAIPVHASTGPEGSLRLRLLGFKTIGT